MYGLRGTKGRGSSTRSSIGRSDLRRWCHHHGRCWSGVIITSYSMVIGGIWVDWCFGLHFWRWRRQRFWCWCCVLPFSCVITWFACLSQLFSGLFPRCIPMCGLLFRPYLLFRPLVIGRLVDCSGRFTLPETARGSWALDVAFHPSVLGKDGCRLRPIAPAEPHHPQDLWGGRLRFH